MKGLFLFAHLLGKLSEGPCKNIFFDRVRPLPGSVLKVDLGLNPVESMCHTGIYVGGDRIVEMTNIDGIGTIQMVTPDQFLNYSLWRTGIYIYVACARKLGGYYPLADPRVAERALAAVGRRTKYNLLLDNCHLFAEHCITGRCDSPIGTLEHVEKVLIREHRLRRKINLFRPGAISSSPIYWMSTGVATGGSFESGGAKGRSFPAAKRP